MLITNTAELYELLSVDRERLLFGEHEGSEGRGGAEAREGSEVRERSETRGGSASHAGARVNTGSLAHTGSSHTGSSHTGPVRTETTAQAKSPEVPRQGSWARRVIDAIPLQGYRSLTGIAQFSGLSLAEVRGVLAELELLGQVRSRVSGQQNTQEWALLR